MSAFRYTVTHRPNLRDLSVMDYDVAVQIADGWGATVDATLSHRYGATERVACVNWTACGSVETPLARRYAEAILFACDLIERIAAGEDVPDEGDEEE